LMSSSLKGFTIASTFFMAFSSSIDYEYSDGR